MASVSPPRIASLIPAGTDIAVALGLADYIVGVSHECDNPAVMGRPVLTEAHVAAAPLAPPGEVDKAVTDAVTAGEALYSTNLEVLAELEPTIVLAQDICDVCAVPERAAREGLPPTARLVVLRAESLAGLEDDVLAVGDACDRHDEAVGLIERLRAIRTEVAQRVAGRPRRRVLTLEWGDPPFIGGHWVPEMVAAAGGDHLLARPGDRSARSTWEQVGASFPDVVVYMPCGYGLDAAAAEAAGLVEHMPQPEWWAADATSLFSRCTPAAVSNGLHALAGMLHPDACPAPAPAQARRIP